jgi:hypothetical protein
LTGIRKPRRQAIQHAPPGKSPQPGAIMLIWGWWVILSEARLRHDAESQAWITLVMPIGAPRWRGVTAMLP